jgi:disulfide bond formation protein DsbB
MAFTISRLVQPRTAIVLILLIAAATIGGALVFEHVFGLAPCPLCLLQRKPYYVAIVVALLGLAVPDRAPFPQLVLGTVAVIFLVSAGLGLYHAGVEWDWWLGPSDCAGAAPPVASGMGDFLRQLETTRVVSCTQAAWRFLGLSLAGWNVLISLALAGLAASSFAHVSRTSARPIG